MLTHLKPQPADKILALMQMYREDPRTDKIDLGVGVYKNAKGVTPVMRAVKAAEQQLWQAETTKSYTGLIGDPAYGDAMINLVLGDSVARDRIAAAATPGGTGAIRQAFELIRLANPDATVWLSNPTWPNHPSILKFLGMPMGEYRYFDSESRGVDFEGMLADLQKVQSGDVVLLHGCCHNPTGANPTTEQWDAIATLATEKGFFPFIDFAYHGFGDGLDEDATAVRMMLGRVPEMAIASSCSKNFGIYRERTGAAIIVSENAERADVVISQVASVARGNYSMPPDHGAAVVRIILEDAQLRNTWEAELDGVRNRMLDLRTELANTLRTKSGTDTFDFVEYHRGMFSRMPVTTAQVDRLRDEYGIYMVGDGRFNVAGLRQSIIEPFADALLAVRG